MSLLVKPCNFCNRPVAKGSGTMLAKNDGTVLWFCSAKCKKNALVLNVIQENSNGLRNTLKAVLKRTRID